MSKIFIINLDVACGGAKELMAAKARIIGMLKRVGFRFLGGWAISPKSRLEVIDTIAEESRLFSSISSTYFKCQMYEINIESESHGLDSSYPYDMIHNYHSQFAPMELIKSINVMAMDNLKKSWLNSEHITRKALRPLKQIMEKIINFNDLCPRNLPVAGAIKLAFDNLQSRGPIEGELKILIMNILGMLSDRSNFILFRRNLLNLDDSSKLIERMKKTNFKLKPNSLICCVMSVQHD